MQETDFNAHKAARIKAMQSSDEELDQAVRSACGSPIRAKRRITEGYSNEVYSAATEDGQEVIIRVHWYDEPHFESEKWALKQCQRIDLPVPKILCLIPLSGEIPRSLCVQTYLEGCTLQSMVDDRLFSNEEIASLIFESGKLLRRLHTVATSGFGRLDAYGKGPGKDWRSAYLGDFPPETLNEAVENVGLDRACVDEARHLLEKYAHLGENVEPCLLHGDFGPDNILVHRGRISGLIDFEFCESGDPAKDVPGSGWWDSFLKRPPVPWDSLLQGYRLEKPLDGAFEQRMRWFQLRGALSTLLS